MSVSSNIDLTAHELKLLAVAVPFAQEFKEKEGRLPSRDELREALHTGVHNAQRILNYMAESDLIKVATRLGALPLRAEHRAAAQYVLGDTSNLTSHVLRENARLTRALAKKEHEKAEARDLFTQEVQKEIDALKVLAKSQIRDTAVRIVRSKELTGNLLEINLPDAHFGKLSWPMETGGAPYDSKITQATYTEAIDVLIERTKTYKFDRILYVIGNDILNANNSESETAHGTIVSSDGRYQKTFWKARNVVVDTVKKLLKIAPVEVMAVYGNHDQLSAWHLADSVECYFHGNKDVIVHNDPTYRKYYNFGKNLIMFTHGDKGHKEDYPLLMAREQPELWGRTMFREVHCGHTHETKMQEFHGVRVRILPALCPADSWHADNGYVGNMRNAEAYIWNKDEGLVGTAIYNVDAQPAITTKREIIK